MRPKRRATPLSRRTPPKRGRGSASREKNGAVEKTKRQGRPKKDLPADKEEQQPHGGQQSVETQQRLIAEREDEVGAGRSYFESHRGQVRTTNLTLADLNIAPPARLEAALEKWEDPFELDQERLVEQIVSRFDQFTFMLAAEHSLLFYGFGSKWSILDQLAQHLTQTHSVVVLNGFNPTLNLRTVLTQIASDILRISGFQKRTLSDYIDAIREGIKDNNIAVVVHNVDGVALRSSESQHALSTLSAIKGISLVASIDHVNAPLLWDGATYARYVWAWIKADTFMPYKAETVFCSKALLRGGMERRVEGAVALLKSLSDRARKLFRFLTERQMGGKTPDGESKQAALRLTFNELFEHAKSKFLASDPATLRTILTELQTHDLLSSRRGADMAEQLWIPLESAQLKDILRQIDTT